MSDRIDRAAEAIANEVPFLSLSVRRRVAHALDNAGLLATPEHDAAVAAKALREAATDAAYGIDWDDVPESVESWLHDRADRIEREAGEPR